MERYNRERLEFVMRVFDNRQLVGPTASVMLAMNDLLEYMDEIEAAAFNRGVQSHEAQVTVGEAARTMTANDTTHELRLADDILAGRRDWQQS